MEDYKNSSPESLPRAEQIDDSLNKKLHESNSKLEIENVEKNNEDIAEYDAEGDLERQYNFGLNLQNDLGRHKDEVSYDETETENIDYQPVNYKSSHENFNRYSPDRFPNEQINNNENSKHEDKDSNIEDDKISKISKSSSASLLRDLEEKWEMIGKCQKHKSRKYPNNHVDFLPDNNKHYLGDGKNRSNPKKKKNVPKQKNIMQANSIADEFYSITAKYYNKTKLSRENYDDNEFDKFVQNKSRILDKYRRTGDDRVYNLQDGNLNGCNFNKNNDGDLLVYESNLKMQNQIADRQKEKPSFLRSNHNANSGTNKNRLLLYRGNVFSYVNQNPNRGDLDNLVYESGVSDDQTGRAILTPSKSLVKKINTTFRLLTGRQSRKSKSQHVTVNQSNSEMPTNRIFSKEENNNEDRLAESNANLNGLDKTFSLSNLDKNFYNLLNKFSPNARRVDTSLKINFKLDFENHRRLKTKTDSIDFDDPKVKNEFQRLKTKSNNNDQDKINDRIFKKINESYNLLKSLFHLNKGSINKEFCSNFILQNRNSINSYSNLNRNNKVCKKNNFDELLNRLSDVDTVKIKKIISLDN